MSSKGWRSSMPIQSRAGPKTWTPNNRKPLQVRRIAPFRSCLRPRNEGLERSCELLRGRRVGRRAGRRRGVGELLEDGDALGDRGVGVEEAVEPASVMLQRV